MSGRTPSDNRITIVHTKRGMLLTKKHYVDWSAVQAEFHDYLTSLGPFSPLELIEYLGIEYPVDPHFAEGAIGDFLESDGVDLWSAPSTGRRGIAAGAIRRFEDAAIEWAGTGYGKPLVDAAVAALMEGLDTPSLRVLAGAPARFADEEAGELAVGVFEELGLDIAEKHSEVAYIALAKLTAQRFLVDGGSSRALASDLWKLYYNSNYREELAEFSGLDDWYVMLDDRVIQGDHATVDEAVRESARRLIAGEPSRGSRLGDALMGSVVVEKPSRWARFRSGFRRAATAKSR